MARPWRWLLICVVGALVLCGATWLWMHHRASKTFDENDAIIKRLTAELGSTPIERPVPGTAVDADARDILEEVYRQVGTLSERETDVITEIVSPGFWIEEPVTAAERVAILERTRPMLDASRPALNASRVGDRTHRRFGSSGYDVSLIAERQTLYRLAMMHAFDHLDRGEVSEALDIAILQWHLSMDEARRATLIGYLVGLGMARASMDQIRRILATREVPAERLDRLAHEIGVLQSRTPALSDTWTMEEAWVRRELGKPDPLGGDLSPEISTTTKLRYLFSDRLMAADALEHLSQGFARLRGAIAGRDGRAAKQAASEIVEETNRSPNPLIRAVFATHALVLHRGIQSATHAELLRVATALARYRAAHGVMPKQLAELVEAGLLSELRDCPYSGAPFAYDGERVWSYGGDGDDDGGRPVPDGDFDEDGDVVYTLRLRGLRTFPWPPETEAADQARVEALLEILTGGGEAAELAREELLGCSPPPFGPLISQFKLIEDSAGLDSEEGRTRAGAVDKTLRSMDAVMRVRWRQPEPISAAMSAEQARAIALRWVNWWFSGQRQHEELNPQDLPQEAADGGDDESGTESDR